MSTGLSVKSIVELADLISHIYSIGINVSVTFHASSTSEECRIAMFNWPEKYMRIAHRWKTLKDEIPADPEQKDIQKENLQRKNLQRNLNSAKESLKNLQEDIQTAQDYIKAAPNTLAQMKAKLKDMEDSFNNRTVEFHASYCRTESSLTDKLNALRKKLNKLQTDKERETARLNKLFVLSFKKKEAAKRHINELNKDIEEVSQICKDTEANLLLAKRNYESNLQEIKDGLDNLRKQINTIEQLVSKNEATIKSKGGEITRLQSKIDTFNKQLKNFHREYLFNNYKHIIKTMNEQI